jgi:rhamnogalacturonyl hydrolase YesR
MAPPFIAYYGALQDSQELLQTAYDQVRLYREVLYDADVGLWQHIALGDGTDPTHWATGNAWAAAGMLRVLATIQQSCFQSEMTSQQSDLQQWIGEILDAVWSYQVSVVSFAVLEQYNETEPPCAPPIAAPNSKRTVRS